MNSRSIILSLVLAAVMVVSVSCRKKLTAVEPTPIAAGPQITIAQLRAMYNYQNIKFTSNTSLYAVVTADETSGNIYRQVYLRDGSGTALTNGYGAIVMRLVTSGGLYIGDSIMINLNGATLDMSSGGALQIDSVNVLQQVAKIKTGLNPLPIPVNLPQITSAWDAQLVQMNGVEFISQQVGSTYALPQTPPASPLSVNRYINDCSGNQMIAYNSGYSNFAADVIPNASGSIVAIANLYSTMQLTLRSVQDVKLTQPYCPIIIDTMTQDFSTAALQDKKNVLLAGWKNIAYKGALEWTATTWGSYPNTHMSPSGSNYKSTDAENDIWFVSPPILVPPGGAPKYMNFSTAVLYPNGNRQMSVLTSSSFDGTNIIPSQWTDLSTAPFFPYISKSVTPPTFAWASNNAPDFTSASCVPFTPPTPNNGTFYVAFRYQSNQIDSSGVTCLLHKVIIKNHP